MFVRVRFLFAQIYVFVRVKILEREGKSQPICHRTLMYTGFLTSTIFLLNAINERSSTNKTNWNEVEKREPKRE